ncbi:hypothetical protein RCC94_10895 [Exiguobacterium acetylicum]|uniref:hypothetical protein n=2 Tax=Bacillales Family XII. Incertae Sedis TaxID=539742 RepID=UPI0027E0892C|nr:MULTISPECIES: hypothetical protein [Exiguobacterium]MDQ6467998.1 hypothetical protein [Exiguobacterium acetylicum]
MQTAREERLQKLALAYRDVEWLGTRWYWNMFLFITVGVLIEWTDLPLLILTIPAVFLASDFRYQLKKRKILDGYISKAQIRRQFLLRIGSHVLLYAVLTVVITQTIERPFWQMLLAIFAILTPLYFISEWIIRRDGKRDPDYISDVEVARFVRQKGTSQWNTYSSDKHV